LYAILGSLTEAERASLKLDPSPQKYTLLTTKGKAQADSPAFAKAVQGLRGILGPNQFDRVSRMVAAMLKLGNMRNSIQESKPLFNEVHKILDFNSSELFSYLMMAKNGMVLKTAEFLERADSLMEVLLCSLVQFVLTALNDNELSRNKELLGGRPALHLIDASGFNDLGAEMADLEGKTNGFSELSSNFFYEHFLSFFNANRFANLEKLKQEGTEEHFVPIDFIDNTKIVQNLNLLVQELSNALSFGEFCGVVNRIFGAFDIDSLKQLVPDASRDGEDARKVTNIEHSFAQFYNYNLMSVFKGNSFRNFSGVQKLFKESVILELFEPVNPSKKKSRMTKQAEEVQELFSGLQNTNVFFFFHLNIPKTHSLSLRSKEVFRQLRGVDFEALIRFHQTAFPYKINYRFFIEKFNVEHKVKQIDPSLNIDFQTFVKSVLKSAFGQNRDDLYIFGHTNLFIRANFYEEINGMLKETGARQRLLVFVERSLAQLLATHIDNSDSVVRLAQTFLVNHCSSNKFQAIKRSKEKFVRLYRKWRLRKEATRVATLILDDFLDKFEYYNLNKVTKIQAIWRGKQARRVQFAQESQQVAAKIFQTKAAKLSKGILATWEALLTNRSIIDKQVNQLTLVSALDQSLIVQRQRMGLRASRAVIGKFIRSYLIRQGIRNIRIDRFKQGYLGRKILKFLRECMGKIRNHYKEVQGEHLKELQNQTQKGLEFQKSLQKATKASNIEQLPAQNVLPARDEIGKTKAGYYLQVISVSLLEKDLANSGTFANQLVSNIALCQREDLLKIELTDNEIIFLTQKQRLLVQKLQEKKQMELRLPAKVDRVSFYEDSFLFLEETGVLKGKLLSFDAPSHTPDVSALTEEDANVDRVFEFTKVNNFLSRGEDICGSTVCRKVFYRSRLFGEQSIPKVFQMKRPVTQLALGVNFMLILDETGVVYSVGDNGYGQLGLGHGQNSHRIQVVKWFVEAKEIVRNIAAGHSHCLASTQSNRVFGWGDNSWFQFGSKHKNYRLRFIQPRDLTSELRPDTNARIQVYCGRQSSYVLSSSMKLISVGRLGASQQAIKPESRKVLPNLPKGVSVVGLAVRWNDFLEIVSLKVVDFRNSSFDKVPFITTSTTTLFEHFLRSPGTNLFPYSEALAKFLPLQVLGTKIVDTKNRNENQRLEKMTENLLCLK
jgi:hypothetical protein